jgi:hypothetical protein
MLMWNVRERRGIVYSVLVGKPEGKRPLGRNRGRQEDNIKVHLNKPRKEGISWINLVENTDKYWTLVNL